MTFNLGMDPIGIFNYEVFVQKPTLSSPWDPTAGCNSNNLNVLIQDVNAQPLTFPITENTAGTNSTHVNLKVRVDIEQLTETIQIKFSNKFRTTEFAVSSPITINIGKCGLPVVYN